jgi:all-trans-8'-apo-beta-carotenal 15,15'-oxygenase
MQCLHFDAERPTQLHLLPRRSDGPAARMLELPSCFVFHHANAFEEANGEVVVDSVRMPQLLDWGFAKSERDFTDVDTSTLMHITLWRTRVTRKGSRALVHTGGCDECATACRRFEDVGAEPPSCEELPQADGSSVFCREVTRRVSEFPTINRRYAGKQHRFVYMATAAHPTQSMPFQAFTKVDVLTGQETLWSAGPRSFVGA